ncbi:MAG: LytTR family transcriptional regulator DNA-binding domain-containing protein [Lachnospira eligens]
MNSGDITYVQSEDHYLTVHTADGNPYVIRKNMMEFDRYNGTDIIRAHKNI